MFAQKLHAFRNMQVVVKEKGHNSNNGKIVQIEMILVYLKKCRKTAFLSRKLSAIAITPSDFVYHSVFSYNTQKHTIYKET